MLPLRIITILLPPAWVILSAASFVYPGDEYNLWGFSSIAGTWILAVAPALHRGQHPRDFLPAVLIVGFLTLLPIGYLLDRLRAPRIAFCLAWLALAGLIVMSTVNSYPSYERAIAKNGSLTAYVLAGANAALTLVALGFIPLAGAIALFRRHGLPRFSKRRPLTDS